MASSANNSRRTDAKTEEPILSSSDFTDTKNILDIIDKLRSQGISKYVDLPQIIVCGEQSSGKSSVLEALSGMTFPTKDAVCTRFATELILRGSDQQTLKISIVPGINENRTDDEVTRLRNNRFPECSWPIDLSQVVEEAKIAMGVREGGKTFSSDILRVELSGPEQPHLTLVDLPGLYQAGSKLQTDADSEVVKSLVLSYMKSPRSIILAVVSAKNDFNNQAITSHARKIDKSGQRTLGLITKPDTLHAGSDSEQFYLKLAQNSEVNFELGWHVLRNRDYPEMSMSLQERKEMEQEFFSKGVWSSVHPSQLGVESLKPRLSQVLKDHIISQLPSVIKQIEDGMIECDRGLQQLGDARGSIREQKRYLFDISSAFSERLKDAINGTYIHRFFGSAALDEGYQKRLRAVIQNTLMDFAKNMRLRGHKYAIQESTPTTLSQESGESPQHGQPEKISRSEYHSKVARLLRRSRGRELSGLFDPLIVGELFCEQCQPWKQLVAEHQEVVVDATYFVLHAILDDCSDERTKEGILSRIIYPGMEKLKTELQHKVDEVLRPHLDRHPITYNHYLTDTVQKAQARRRETRLSKVLDGFFKGTLRYNNKMEMLYRVDPRVLLHTLSNDNEFDMETYGAETATDFMEAYYKVAQKNVVDALSTTAIEECLIQKLPTLFSLESVIDLEDSTITAIAAEDAPSTADRARYLEKLAVLEKGLKELKSLQKFQPFQLLTDTVSSTSDRRSGDQVSSPQSSDSKIDPLQQVSRPESVMSVSSSISLEDNPNTAEPPMEEVEIPPVEEAANGQYINDDGWDCSAPT